MFVFNCGFAIIPKANITIPTNTETEIFRFNVIYGEVQNLYGLNSTKLINVSSEFNLESITNPTDKQPDFNLQP
ncbi:hypothetical protein LEP1GSC170_1122 [Leptospira interrogans serovar Bataviae str. HAI135]|nr:hypothetical protein LEP1GSC170_1122 [Leptospira interrogans serovar Bataviae str. HAI135]